MRETAEQIVTEWWDDECEGLGFAITADDLDALTTWIASALRTARATTLEEAAVLCERTVVPVDGPRIGEALAAELRRRAKEGV